MLSAISSTNFMATPLSSTEGLGALQSTQGVQTVQAVGTGQSNNNGASTSQGTQKKQNQTGNSATSELTPQQQQAVEKLAQRDRDVRAHEQAHMTAGGNLVRGSAYYDYQTGPDGKRYAVGGEVKIDTSPIKDDPKATMSKAERIKRAALAPSDPSSQDRSVAAEASQMEMQAQQEMMQQNMQKLQGSSDTSQKSGQTDQGAKQAVSSSAQKAYGTAQGNNALSGPVLGVFSA
jgi:hypothetical protein